MATTRAAAVPSPTPALQAAFQPPGSTATGWPPVSPRHPCGVQDPLPLAHVPKAHAMMQTSSSPRFTTIQDLSSARAAARHACAMARWLPSGIACAARAQGPCLGDTLPLGGVRPLAPALSRGHRRGGTYPQGTTTTVTLLPLDNHNPTCQRVVMAGSLCIIHAGVWLAVRDTCPPWTKGLRHLECRSAWKTEGRWMNLKGEDTPVW